MCTQAVELVATTEPPVAYVADPTASDYWHQAIIGQTPPWVLPQAARADSRTLDSGRTDDVEIYGGDAPPLGR